MKEFINAVKSDPIGFIKLVLLVIMLAGLFYMIAFVGYIFEV